MSSEVIWQETFDTSLSDNWTVTHGDVEVIDNSLEGTDCFNHGFVRDAEICSAALWFGSTATTGTWSVDYYLSDPAKSSFLFYFIAEGNSSISGAWPAADYMMFLWGTDFESGNDVRIDFGYHHNDDVRDSNTTYVTTTELQGWTHIDITRSEEGSMKLYLDGLLQSTFSQISPVLQKAEHLNFQISIGDKIDNLRYSDTINITPTISTSTNTQTISSSTVQSSITAINTTDPESDKKDNMKFLFLGSGVGISGILIIGSMGYKRKLATQAVNAAKIIKTIAETSQSFEVTDYSMLALMVKPSKLDNIDSDEFQASIPNELLSHRYLMHPIRITIMKLLNSNDFLPSFEIRQILGITWGEYNTHLRSLEAKEYIDIRNTFSEKAELIVTLFVTKKGQYDYQELLDLLIKFTQKDAPIRRLVGENNHPIYDTNLYPSPND